MAEESRADLLWRAIENALAQDGVESEVVIVVNGKRFDPELFAQLKSDKRLIVSYLEEGNVSLARYHGVKQSAGTYFGFLDDDDEYLPNALSVRVAEMQRNPNADVVVTNGYIHYDVDEPLVDDAFTKTIQDDSLLSFLEKNWFASPASLFRTKSVPADIFEIRLKYFEWSYLFFKLYLLNKKITFTRSLTYRIYKDNPLSVSKSLDYALAYPEFLLDLYALPLPERVRKRIRRKYQTALNVISNLHLREGDIKAAFRYHVKCLMNGGWRFLPYTRKILANLIGR